jgi:hypothetical protein
MRTTEAAGIVSELIEKTTIGFVPKPSTFLDIASQLRLTIILQITVNCYILQA